MILKTYVTVIGSFLAKEKYLVVADHEQKKIYQLKPNSGEVRAIITERCRPDTVTFDPSTNDLYMTCVEYYHNTIYYDIRKKPVDAVIDKIYDAPRGKKQHLFSVTLFKYVTL